MRLTSSLGESLPNQTRSDSRRAQRAEGAGARGERSGRRRRRHAVPVIAAKACAVVCTPTAAARARDIAFRARDRGRAVRVTLHGDGPADPRWTGRARAGRAEATARGRPTRRPRPGAPGTPTRSAATRWWRRTRRRRAAAGRAAPRAAAAIAAWRAPPERRGRAPGGPSVTTCSSAVLRTLVVRPRHAGLIVRERERVEPLAERRQRVERWAGVDRADDAAEAPALPRLPGVPRAALGAGRQVARVVDRSRPRARHTGQVTRSGCTVPRACHCTAGGAASASWLHRGLGNAPAVVHPLDAVAEGVRVLERIGLGRLLGEGEAARPGGRGPR